VGWEAERRVIMKRSLLTSRKCRLTLAGVGFAIAAGAVIAQPTEVVVVEAARALKAPSPSSVATVREVSLQGWVRYADLDLSTGAGANELEKRIGQTAKELCKELDDKYPLIEGDNCVKNAVDAAMVDARKAIGAKGGPAISK
jgi:UrcA family protein